MSETDCVVSGAWMEIQIQPAEGDDPIPVHFTTDDIVVDFEEGAVTFAVLLSESLAGLRDIGLFDAAGTPVGDGVSHHKASIVAYNNYRDADVDDPRVMVEYVLYDAHVDSSPIRFPVDGCAQVDVTITARGEHGFETFSEE